MLGHIYIFKEVGRDFLSFRSGCTFLQEMLKAPFFIVLCCFQGIKKFSNSCNSHPTHPTKHFTYLEPEKIRQSTFPSEVKSVYPRIYRILNFQMFCRVLCSPLPGNLSFECLLMSYFFQQRENWRNRPLQQKRQELNERNKFMQRVRALHLFNRI